MTEVRITTNVNVVEGSGNKHLTKLYKYSIVSTLKIRGNIND